MSNEALKVKEVEIVALLKRKMEDDIHFRESFENTVNFYWFRMSELKQSGLDEEEVYEKFSQFAQTLFYNGYFLMTNWLEAVKEDEQALEEAKEFLQLSPNALRNAMPFIVNQLFDDQWTVASGSDFYMMWFVRNVTFPTPDFLEQIRKDIIMQGCYQSVLDHPLYKGKNIENDTVFLIGSPADIYFLSPQVYITANSLGESHERWSMHFWSNNKMSDYEIGSIILLREESAEADTQLVVNIQIQNLIVETERNYLIQSLLDLIPADKLKNVILPYFIYQDADVLVPISEDETKEKQE